MKILKADIQPIDIKAPDHTPTSGDSFTAAICDDGRLVLAYMDANGKALYLGFNTWETTKIRSVLSKGGL